MFSTGTKTPAVWPALGEHLLHRVHQVLAIEPDLEALGIDGPFSKQISSPGHFQTHSGGRAIERGQPRFGGLFAGGFVGIDVAVGVYRRQTIWGFVVVQGDDGQLAGFLVLMLGADRLVGTAITQPELPPADVATCQGDGAQRCTTRALTTLALHHQQLAVRHFSGAVELLGEPGDEVEVRLAELICARHYRVNRAHRRPAVACRHILDDAGQAHPFPTAAARGLATATHVAGFTPDHQRIGWAGQLDLIHGVTPKTG